MNLLTRRLGLITFLAIEAGAVVLLHRLGSLEWLRIDWSDLSQWLEFTPVEDALAAVVRLIALGLGYWLVGTTLLYTVAKLLRVPAALLAVEWATIPAVRRIVDGAVAVSLVSATFGGAAAPALAQDPVPIVVQVDEEGLPVPPTPTPTTSDDVTTRSDGGVIVPPGLDHIGWTPRPAGLPPEDTTAASPEAATAAPIDARATVHTVVKGDHMWSISGQHLASATDRPPTTSEIARYWRRVIDANHDRFRSGDPDLIFPGEDLILPPIDQEDR